jgi:hypothetical protein
MSKFDYQDLLKRYIHHVGKCEGTFFIDAINDPWFMSFMSDVKFTTEEIAELKALCDDFLFVHTTEDGE